MNLNSGTPLAISKIISPGQYTHMNIDIPESGKVDASVREYGVSPLGRYLVDPQAIIVKRRLVGCDIHWKMTAGTRALPKFARKWIEKRKARPPVITLVTGAFNKSGRLSNDGLQAHVQKLEEKLRPFDSLQTVLAGLDLSRVDKIVGICQDRFGGRSPLAINGDPAKQRNYMQKNVGIEVPVKLERAHMADGLFELQGFDADQFSHAAVHPLIRFTHNGKAMACILNEDRSVAFWLDALKTIGYLQLFEYCLQSNRQMRASLNQCLIGSAQPVRLLFNQALEIDYGKAPLPAVYREIIDGQDKTSVLTRSIKQSLNRYQMGVSLNSVRRGDADEQVLCTDISILQEMRALEPIRHRFPEVFDAVTQKASFSDAGRFYMLDSISGVDQHEA